MAYSLKRGTGEIRKGRTTFERGFYTGERIVRVTPTEFNVHNAAFTTCDLEHPHYYFWAHRMKILSDDKVIAEPVILLIEGVPAAVLPFWIFPVKKGRHTGFLMPRVGQTDYEGRFIKNISYFQILTDYSDATLSFDYMERLGWAVSVEGRFLYAPRIESQFNGKFSEDRVLGSRRWNAVFDHRQLLGPRLNLTLSGNFVSDRRYYQEFGEDQYSLLNRNLHSYLSLDRSWRTSSASLVVSQDRNLDVDSRTEYFPRFTYNLFRRKLPRNVYGSFRSNAVNSRIQTATGDERHQGVDNAFALSSTAQAFGWLNLNPSFGYRETWYDRDRSGTSQVRRGLYELGLGANLTLYGTPVLPGLGSLRHVFTPGVSYGFRPDVDQSRYFVFGGISNYPATNSAGLSVHNGFQWMREQESGTTRLDLASLDFGTGYDFRRDIRPLNPLTTVFTVLPLQRWAQVRASAVHDLYGRRLENLSLATSLQFSNANVPLPAPRDTSALSDTIGEEGGPPPAQPWRLSLSHGYIRGSTGAVSQQLWGQVQFNLSKNWRVSYGQRYDLTRKESVSREVQLFRDLHCWEARLHWWTLGERWFYEFRLGIKALPDIKFERKESGY
jgi:lipopolysaccharide assembly outer membrane protein LptD (OstA)